MPSIKKPERHILDGRDKFVEDILRLLKNGSFTDIRIILEDGEILANKDVLATRCEYFATMFSNNEVKFIEGETNSVDLSYCSKVVMDKIIDYLFSGEMKFNDFNLEQLLSLMNMASLMLLDDVFVHVENFIIGWLPDSGVNCAFLPELISGLILAEQFKLDAIKDVIKLELHKSLKDIPHIPDIVKDSLTFKFLPYSLLKDILLHNEDKNGFSPSTRQKFDAFVFWLSGNSCSEAEKKEIVDSFNFDDFTAEELLTEVRLSGLYSVSRVSSKALKILQKKDEEQQKKDEELQKKDEELQKKDELISSQSMVITSTKAMLSERDQQIQGLINSLEAKEKKIKQYEASESAGYPAQLIRSTTARRAPSRIARPLICDFDQP